MIKCINSNSLQRTKDIPDLISQAQGSGFDYLELSLEPSGLPGKTSWDDLRKEIHDAGLRIVSLTSTQFDLFTLAGLSGEPERNIAKDTVAQYLHCASSSGSDTMVRIAAHEIYPPDQVTINEYETALNCLFQTIAKLSAIAEELKAPLTIENPAAGLLLSPLELRDFIDQVNNPYLGICLSPAHAAWLGNPLDWFGILDQRISALCLNSSTTSNADEENMYSNLIAYLKKQNRNIPALYKYPRYSAM